MEKKFGILLDPEVKIDKSKRVFEIVFKIRISNNLERIENEKQSNFQKIFVTNAKIEESVKKLIEYLQSYFKKIKLNISNLTGQEFGHFKFTINHNERHENNSGFGRIRVARWYPFGESKREEHLTVSENVFNNMVKIFEGKGIALTLEKIVVHQLIQNFPTYEISSSNKLRLKRLKQYKKRGIIPQKPILISKFFEQINKVLSLNEKRIFSQKGKLWSLPIRKPVGKLMKKLKIKK